jgi:hypothetical protein
MMQNNRVNLIHNTYAALELYVSSLNPSRLYNAGIIIIMTIVKIRKWRHNDVKYLPRLT